MPATAIESQLVGDVCKACIHNNHTWVNGRLSIFNCEHPKSCAPDSPDDLRNKAGTNKKCPLKRVN